MAPPQADKFAYEWIFECGGIVLSLKWYKKTIVIYLNDIFNDVVIGFGGSKGWVG